MSNTVQSLSFLPECGIAMIRIRASGVRQQKAYQHCCERNKFVCFSF